MSDADRDALTQAALGVAGIQMGDVNTAIDALGKTGSTTAVDDLMTKAASNLGMPSSAALRDQILPSLGITVPASN